MVQHVLVNLPVRTPEELASFDHAMRNATEGYSIGRSLAYTNFRIAVMHTHQTGSHVSSKHILTQCHSVHVDNGHAVLFRYVQDTGVADPEHDQTPIDSYDCVGDDHDESNKGVKRKRKTILGSP
jgi:hypothetical protein